MIILKNMKTKVAMLAPCKNGSTSIESAWIELLSDYAKKHECKIKNHYPYNRLNLTKYKKIYLLTRPDYEWYLSGYRMNIKLYADEFPKPPANFEQHLLEVKRFYQRCKETAHLDDRTVRLDGWNPQWLGHCAMNSKWIHKYVLDNSPHVEYIDINNTEKFQSTLEKIHPKLKVLHINKTSSVCSKCNREFDKIEDQTDLVKEIINTV
ncbi:hypothetical protein N9993_00295 [bacterium]|nr:hypothetical protein [bacterium]